MSEDSLERVRGSLTAGPQKTRKVTVKQISRMRSTDFGVPMSRVGEFNMGLTNDGKRMNAKDLAADIKSKGQEKPGTVGFGYRGNYFINGHHRYVAMRDHDAGTKKMNVKIDAEDYKDVVHGLAHYTPPNQDYTWEGYGTKNKRKNAR